MIDEFAAIKGDSQGYWKLLLGMGALLMLGGLAFIYIEVNGHGVTGMNNTVVWGLPHIFAISLLVMASGSLNLGSMSTIFAVKHFKQFGRFSAFLAIVMLAGGLAVLVLDLGRPDRMLLVMMHMNFRSMFTWNVFLYSGFTVLCFLYLWSMFQYPQFTKVAGSAAFAWRFVLTTGTGSIFGVIHAREVFHSAITAPTFVAISLTSGTALSILLLLTTFRLTERELDLRLLHALRNALIFFLLLVLYLLIVEKFTKFYSPAFYDVESWILTGSYAWLYWGGVVLLGVVGPLLILFNSHWGNQIGGIALASVMVVVGLFCFVGFVLIAGQAYPMNMFPGYEMSSVFQDGMEGSYTPTLWELMLGLGGVGVSGVLYLLGIRFFRLLPKKATAPQGWDVAWHP
ncbi:NrfD/PsrC family molybdoenzyme membrane anchor subunit [Candidatus Magnetaquicoccus inordinatus]|uniref:NrfD/PsrC family molybdoenzyme membrane anchor subunit n=1 Tax=Candidatus Magnetaquicoccus inordinatus TaxID=2496818 RepID=UPI00102B267C|nr:NrfD/PsrC family molybdoenzyme membrane anchor subunit [Candidatus Magnetaquicoccus inordinatus]